MRLLLRHASSRGIGGERDPRPALARRAAGPWEGLAVKITEDVRKYAAEQGVAEEAALQTGMEEKSREFAFKGSELYAKA